MRERCTIHVSRYAFPLDKRLARVSCATAGPNDSLMRSARVQRAPGHCVNYCYMRFAPPVMRACMDAARLSILSHDGRECRMSVSMCEV